METYARGMEYSIIIEKKSNSHQNHTGTTVFIGLKLACVSATMQMRRCLPDRKCYFKHGAKKNMEQISHVYVCQVFFCQMDVQRE